MTMSTFSEPSNRAGEWSDTSLTWFWNDPNPFTAKYAMEKMTGVLLERDADDMHHLSYRGVSTTGNHTRSLRLCFEAVIRGRNLYSLCIHASAPRKWSSEEAFLEMARRTFEFWCEKLAIPASDIAWHENLPDLYERRRSEALDAEAAAAVRVDASVPVTVLQQQILAALRSGMIFFTAHKEGGTHLKFDGESFLRSDYGEAPGLQRFATDEEMLACLRAFFDWESRRGTYPHRPPEREVWEFIRSQMVKPHA